MKKYRNYQASCGFLLLEVLGALVFFVIIVSVFSRFMLVLVYADIDQKKQHRSLTRLCDMLEFERFKVNTSRQEITLDSDKDCTLEPVSVQHVWVTVPEWVFEVQRAQSWVNYRVTSNITKSIGPACVIRVTG